jgi:putative oxidoreductase
MSLHVKSITGSGSMAVFYLNTLKTADFFLQPLLSLLFRLWLAKIFFYSGLTKIQTWSSTLALFEYEYNVPFLPFELAAWLATGAELLLPCLLVIGLASRFSAAGLFILNLVAAFSYPDISPAGINDHYFWGAMALVVTVFGPGLLSLDHWISRKFGSKPSSF